MRIEQTKFGRDCVQELFLSSFIVFIQFNITLLQYIVFSIYMYHNVLISTKETFRIHLSDLKSMLGYDYKRI